MCKWLVQWIPRPPKLGYNHPNHICISSVGWDIVKNRCIWLSEYRWRPFWKLAAREVPEHVDTKPPFIASHVRLIQNTGFGPLASKGLRTSRSGWALRAQIIIIFCTPSRKSWILPLQPAFACRVPTGVICKMDECDNQFLFVRPMAGFRRGQWAAAQGPQTFWSYPLIIVCKIR